MQTLELITRLEAIRLRQIELISQRKTNPQVYEALVLLPVDDLVKMFAKVDQVRLEEEIDDTIKKLKNGLKQQ